MGQDNNDIRPITKPITKRAQLEHILSQLSHQQLQQFILNTALHNKDLHETLLITFSDLLSNDEPEESRYRDRLYKILTQYTNQDGFISAKNAHGLAASIDALLKTAQKATTPLRESIDLCTSVIDIMPRLGEKMDDSEGHLYELMQLACSILLECFDNLKPEAQHNCFNRMLAIYGDPEYLDLDLDSFVLALLKEWATGNKDWQTACLHQQELMRKDSKDDKWRQNYLMEQTREVLDYWKQAA